METNKAEPLDDAVATLNGLIELTQKCGLADSAQFLAMAKTQLLIELNGITDAEFCALCDWLEGKRPRPGARRNARTRGRHDGDMRVMRRAWRCREDLPAGRAGRRRASPPGR